MQANITSKVAEFNTNVGNLVVWKVLEEVIFQGIFSSLYTIYQHKVDINQACLTWSSQYADLDSSKTKLLEDLRNVPMSQFKVPSKFQLSGVQTLSTTSSTAYQLADTQAIWPSYFSHSKDIFWENRLRKGMNFMDWQSTRQLRTCVETCEAIAECVKQHYVTNVPQDKGSLDL